MVPTLEALAPIVRGQLPIGGGDRSLRLGPEPVFTLEGSTPWMSIHVGELDARIAPIDAVLEGADVALRGWFAAVTVASRGKRGRWSAVRLDTRVPVDLYPRATVEAWTRALLAPQWLGSLADKPTKYTFELAPPSIAQVDDGSLEPERIVRWCARQLDGGSPDDRAPESARVLETLFHFAASVGGTGLFGYLLQANGAAVRTAYGALVTVGARTLAERLASGVTLAARHGAELAVDRFNDWPAEMRAVAPCRISEELDGETYPGAAYLLANELRVSIARYVRRHASELTRAA